MDWSGRSSAKHLTILKMKEDREAVDGFVLFLTEPFAAKGVKPLKRFPEVNEWTCSPKKRGPAAVAAAKRSHTGCLLVRVRQIQYDGG